MVQKLKLAAFFLAILVAFGAADGSRNVGKYDCRACPPRQVEQNASPQVIWGKRSARLVQSLGYQPQSVCNPVDTPIEFDLSMSLDATGATNYTDALADLEFRLLAYSNDKWSVVSDWRHWPLPPYRATGPGMVALQVDARRKDDPQAVDSRWLNQFTFLPDRKPYQSHLFRTLIAMHFDVLDEEKLRDLLADELQLVVALLHDDQLALDHGEQVRRLRRLRCVGRLASAGPHDDTITLRSGAVLHWNGQQHWLQEEGTAVALRLGAADSPEYGDLVRRCAKLPDDAVAAAAAAFFVQSSYYYGTPSNPASWSARDSVASCEQLGLILQRMLAGHAASSKLIALSCANKGTGHILVQAVTADSKTPLLIDPTAGCIYLCDLRGISPKNLPEAIALPHFRSIPGCDVKSLVDSSSTILSYDCPKRHIFPSQFGITSVILQPK